jgi:hypothetical protein
MRPSILALIAFTAGALGGVVSSIALGEAHAAPGEVTVPVPADGVVFRAADGRAILRIESDRAGGVLEVLDSRERVAVRLRATPNGGVVELGPSPTVRPVLAPAGALADPGY